MACGCCCLSKLIQIAIIYGYPGYKVLYPNKENEKDNTKSQEEKDREERLNKKLWIIYFLIVGILSVLEGTLLFPIIFILNKICLKIVPTLKVLFHLWLYYPEYRGALYLDQQFGNYIDKVFLILNPKVGRLLDTFFKIPNRDTAGVIKRNE